MARPSFWKVLQFAAGAFLVILAVRSLVLNWQELRAQPLEWRFSPTWLLASVLVVFAGYAVLIEAWRRHYNTVRPHSSLGYRPPAPETETPPRRRRRQCTDNQTGPLGGSRSGLAVFTEAAQLLPISC